jgi:hypothetical protein
LEKSGHGLIEALPWHLTVETKKIHKKKSAVRIPGVPDKIRT